MGELKYKVIKNNKPQPAKTLAEENKKIEKEYIKRRSIEIRNHLNFQLVNKIIQEDEYKEKLAA